jgi:2-amino-4-hydroxy-6-hydroxymethyldihydropteridine diphosphokinase
LYYNQVIVFESQDSPRAILENCLSIEKKIGRTRNEQEEYSDRPIDIDILYVDDQIIEEKELHIPHPRLHLRRFTLEPLVEILPDFIHPILKKDHKSLLLLCSDSGKVEVVK